jgi:hypothetical protein
MSVRARFGAERPFAYRRRQSGTVSLPALPAFEEFCTVTQSVRKGIDVAVSVQQPVSAQTK